MESMNPAVEEFRDCRMARIERARTIESESAWRAKYFPCAEREHESTARALHSLRLKQRFLDLCSKCLATELCSEQGSERRISVWEKTIKDGPGGRSRE